MRIEREDKREIGRREGKVNKWGRKNGRREEKME